MTKKYIDAEKLREKIEEQMDTLPREVGRGAGTITSKGYGMMQAFQIVRSIIDSLQREQPEVELEKASRNVYESWKGGTMDDFLRDMVELGKALNTRKG